MLHLIRHAQSQMNLAKAEHGDRLYSETGVVWDRTLVDAAITENGLREIAGSRAAAHQLQVTKVYVSPMRRALQTCDGLFSAHPNSPRVVVFPYATEIVSDAGDLPLGNSAHRDQFPQYDWSLIDQQHSKYWLASVTDSVVIQNAAEQCKDAEEVIDTLCSEMAKCYPDYLELKKEAKRRVATMREILLRDIENGESLAVVGHADILRQLMKAIIPRSEAVFLSNCQIFSVRV